MPAQQKTVSRLKDYILDKIAKCYSVIYNNEKIETYDTELLNEIDKEVEIAKAQLSVLIDIKSLCEKRGRF